MELVLGTDPAGQPVSSCRRAHPTSAMQLQEELAARLTDHAQQQQQQCLTGADAYRAVRDQGLAAVRYLVPSVSPHTKGEAGSLDPQQHLDGLPWQQSTDSTLSRHLGGAHSILQHLQRGRAEDRKAAAQAAAAIQQALITLNQPQRDSAAVIAACKSQLPDAMRLVHSFCTSMHMTLMCGRTQTARQPPAAQVRAVAGPCGNCSAHACEGARCCLLAGWLAHSPALAPAGWCRRGQVWRCAHPGPCSAGPWWAGCSSAPPGPTS